MDQHHLLLLEQRNYLPSSLPRFLKRLIDRMPARKGRVRVKVLGCEESRAVDSVVTSRGPRSETLTLHND